MDAVLQIARLNAGIAKAINALRQELKNKQLEKRETNAIAFMIATIDDKILKRKVMKVIYDENATAETALQKIAEQYSIALEMVTNRNIRQRAPQLKEATRKISDSLPNDA